MDNQPVLERLISVRIRMHASSYLVIALIAGILATQYPVSYPLEQRILLGLLGGLLFMASLIIVLLLNNLSVILMRIPVKNCSLFVFGGVALVPEDRTHPGREIAAAIVTFLINLMMATVFNWLFLIKSGASSISIVLILQWLAFFWYMLALVHILPAFPLAGGRILAATLWKTRWNYLRSVRLATAIGRGSGIGAILGGIVLIALARQTENGLIVIFFGWALQAGAAFSIQRSALLSTLLNTTARNIMRPFPSISTAINLEELVSQRIRVNGQDFFAVTDGEKIMGILTLQNIKRVPRGRWSSTPAGAIVTPWETTRKIPGDYPGAYVFEELEQYQALAFPVSENNSMIGTIEPDDLYHFARTVDQVKS